MLQGRGARVREERRKGGAVHAAAGGGNAETGLDPAGRRPGSSGACRPIHTSAYSARFCAYLQ